MNIIDLITSRDFVVNILAGLSIFALDVLLITLVLPTLVQRRLQAQWTPVRADLANIIINTAESYYWIGVRGVGSYPQEPGKPPAGAAEQRLFRNAEYAQLTRACEDTHSRLVSVLPMYAPALDADLARTLSQLLRHFDALRGQLGHWPTLLLDPEKQLAHKVAAVSDAASAVVPLIEHLHRRIGSEPSTAAHIILAPDTTPLNAPVMLDAFAPAMTKAAAEIANNLKNQ